MANSAFGAQFEREDVALLIGDGVAHVGLEAPLAESCDEAPLQLTVIPREHFVFVRLAGEEGVRLKGSRNPGQLPTAAEHARHRADQVARHEITVVPHLDALLLVAEPAWRAPVQVERAHHHAETMVARFVPRARRWVVVSAPAPV